MTKRVSPEVGHAQNVANFTALIRLIEDMGPLYTPQNPDIKIKNLLQHREQLRIHTQRLSATIPPFKNAVAGREHAFMALSKLVTRVKNSFNALKLPKEEKDHIANLVRNITEDKSIAKAEKLDRETCKTISNAQLGYAKRAEHFQTLINTLATYRAYTPDEASLRVSRLGDLYVQLKHLNYEAECKAYALLNARKQRNNLLYNNEVNLLGLVDPIKDYIKSVAGAESYFKSADALQFFNNPKT